MKFKSSLMHFAGMCAALGVLLSVMGLCLGGRLTNVEVYWDNGPRVRYEEAKVWDMGAAETPPAAQSSAAPVDEMPVEDIPEPGVLETVSGDIRSLKVEVGAGTLIIETGDTFSCFRGGVSSRVKNGCWTVEASADQECVLTVPEGVYLEKVDIELGAGRLVMSGIDCGKLDLEVGAGAAELSDITCGEECDLEVGLGSIAFSGGAIYGKADISCGMGHVTVEDIGRPDAYGYDVECAMGSITIDGHNFSGFAEVQEKKKSEVPLYFEVECGAGSVRVDFA